MLYAIVFDFDGVLADSEPLHFDAFRRVLAAHGVTLTREEYDTKYLGFDDAGAFGAILRDRGQSPDRAAIDALVEEKLHVFEDVVGNRNVLFPGASDCVRRLGASLPLAIASGALTQDIDLILSGTGLRDAFEVVVGAEHTPRSKPHPDPYALAVRLLQERGRVPPGAAAAAGCVAIEDSRWGIQSAKAAGLRCIAVTTSYEARDLTEADLVVDSLDEVSLPQLAALAAAP
jgi:beta-phosphoglucomutase